MRSLAVVGHLLALGLLPIPFVGVINRTKALWAGRRGPPVFQTLFDLIRLLRKHPVYSDVTTPVFRVGPLVLLATTIVSAFFVPLGGRAPLSFPFDFVAIAYLWGLGRIALILPALDTGSSFEGMGASREATYGALVEPALFLAFGALMLATGHRSLSEMLRLAGTAPDRLAISATCALALFIVLQVEAARVPVDDPSTHLELTMIHEVMVLDHSGPDLAIVQYAAALKMTIGAVLLAALVNPFGPSELAPSLATSLVVVFLVAVAIGCVESLIARLRLRTLPKYIAVSAAAAFAALLLASWK